MFSMKYRKYRDPGIVNSQSRKYRYCNLGPSGFEFPSPSIFYKYMIYLIFFIHFYVIIAKIAIGLAPCQVKTFFFKWTQLIRHAQKYKVFFL